LSLVAQGLVECGPGMLIVAGGEASGTCVQAHCIRQLQVGPQIDAGVPWCYAAIPLRHSGLHVSLKSGNFGPEDFFSKAFDLLTPTLLGLMTETELRQDICRVGRSLFERGYVHATTGNISTRLADGFLITPTDACRGFLEPELLARVGLDDVQLSGSRASRTLLFRRRIYGADPDAHCVIHTHSTHLVELTLSGVWNRDDILPPITPYYVMKVGHVPLID
jgi:hypothetical protein